MRRRYEKRSHPPGVRASFSVLLYPLRLLLSIIWPALFVGLFGQRGGHQRGGFVLVQGVPAGERGQIFHVAVGAVDGRHGQPPQKQPAVPRGGGQGEQQRRQNGRILDDAVFPQLPGLGLELGLYQAETFPVLPQHPDRRGKMQLEERKETSAVTS